MGRRLGRPVKQGPEQGLLLRCQRTHDGDGASAWQRFLQITLPLLRPSLAVATILVVISVLLLTTVELLRRRSDRLRGVTGR